MLKRLVDGAAEHQEALRKIRDEANRARSMAAEGQHKISNPRAGEKKESLVVPQVEARPEQPNRTSEAKATILEVSRPAVERAETILCKTPDLTEDYGEASLYQRWESEDSRRGYEPLYAGLDSPDNALPLLQDKNLKTRARHFYYKRPNLQNTSLSPRQE